MRLQTNVNKQVAGRPAADARRTLSGQTQYCPIPNTRGNRDFQSFLAGTGTATMAYRTAFSVFRSSAAALWTWFFSFKGQAAARAAVGLLKRDGDFRFYVAATHA